MQPLKILHRQMVLNIVYAGNTSSLKECDRFLQRWRHIRPNRHHIFYQTRRTVFLEHACWLSSSIERCPRWETTSRPEILIPLPTGNPGAWSCNGRSPPHTLSSLLLTARSQQIH